MGVLAQRIDQIDSVRKTLKSVLNHFVKMSLSKEAEEQLSLAANLAFSDELLFEKFQMWSEDRDDETLLYHIDRYFKKIKQKPLLSSERNLTSQRKQTETSIKENVRSEQKKVFAERLTSLAAKRNLLTNEALGNFLGVSGEQARKFKAGENKPQLATLKAIAGKFKVSVEFLLGIKDA